MRAFFIVFVIISATSRAEVPINNNMRVIAETMRELLTTALSEESFADKKQAGDIQKRLILLEKLFVANKAHFDERSGDWRLNHRTMVGLVSQARRASLAGNKEVARQMVKAIPGLCLSCHGQDHLQAKVFAGQLPEAVGPLARAEFALATRRPLDAERYLGEFLAQKNLSPSNREAIGALRGELQVQIVLARPKDKVHSWLKQRTGMFKRNPEISTLLKGWLAGLAKAELALPRPLKDVSEVPAALQRGLGTAEPELGLLADAEEEIVFLYLREELHRLLSAAKPGPQHADLYFWLSFSERAVGYNFFYSLSDGYLRACMDEWALVPTAKKCYREYKAFVEFAYTGSSGTDIPADVRAELESYRRKVGVK